MPIENIDETAILAKLTGFDRQNSDDIEQVHSTDAALDYMASLLDEAGITVEFQNYTIGEGEKTLPRKNLIARLDDREDLPRIGLEGHIDTLPFGNYKGNPLGEVKDGRIYGRGTVDMSGAVACMVQTMIQTKQFKERSASPVLIVTSDEEANSFAGINRYLQDNPKLDFAICGEASAFAIKDRFKGALYYIVTIKGKVGHGSRQYEGENAIVKGAPVFQALVGLYGRVPAIKNEAFRSEDLNSHRSSMNLGIIQAGTKVNTIPDTMRIELEMRLVQPAEQYLDLIADTLAPHRQLIGEETLIFAKDPIILTLDQSNPFYEKLQGLKAKRAVGIGFDEANVMNRRGIPTIVFGPGNATMVYSDEEFIDIEDLKTYTEKIVGLIR